MDSIILLGLGAALFLLGVYLKRRSIGKNAAFTERVEAKVVSLLPTTTNDQGESSYRPVLEYAFGGRSYRTDGRETLGTPMKEGDVFAIFIRPEAPQDYCLVKGGETILSLAAKGFGAFLIACAVLAAVL